MAQATTTGVRGRRDNQGVGSRAFALSSLITLALATGCAVESAAIDPLPLAVDCVCSDGQCPPSVCALSITVDSASCGGEVATVEVMIGETLEAVVLRPGQTLQSCASIARGAAAEMRARADTAWAWSELIACPAAVAGEANGPTIDRVLHCAIGG